MLLIVQLTATTPELKLLMHGAYVDALVLSKQVQSNDPNQPPLNIGWRIIDRSQTAASPDCLLLTPGDEAGYSYQLQPITTVKPGSIHNLKEFCLNTGDYVLQDKEQVTLLLDIDTGM
ncbi:hypothetical protein ESA94_11115 [Lacibacter luteus]|uniref:Uncharacterized protein n=1 Tax=Lacibacter luteus TaxID=2508719 RepID=A0A4Q1CHU1_9BACT|nr:hypothetical protein [Lacibacter luteus]RXK59614.1 hypothetical protein ESA94_11115 [Lacibacter luteus]